MVPIAFLAKTQSRLKESRKAERGNHSPLCGPSLRPRKRGERQPVPSERETGPAKGLVGLHIAGVTDVPSKA
eukprot:901862-Amphidinium_carterae.1